MKHPYSILVLFVSNICFGQSQYKLGESEFTIEKEHSTVFTSFDGKNVKALPDSIDLSSSMPPAGDQGSKGSCWAWATTYVIRSVMDNNQSFITSNNLNQRVYSPEYVYQVYKGDSEDCDWGATSSDMLGRILRDGAVKFSDFEYDAKACNKQPDIVLKNRAKQFAKPEYKVDVLNDLFSIQKILSEKQPLVISIRVDDFFCSPGNINKKSPYWRSYHTRRGSHAMVIVGYNKRLNALKVLNSWGTSFGNDGYVWIDYSIINSAMNYSCYPKKIEIDSSSLKPQGIEETSEIRTTKSNSSSKWPSLDVKSLSTWLKEGYFRVFDNFRVGLATFDEKNEFAVIDIRNLKGDMINSFYVEKNSSKEFFVKGGKYQFTFNNIGQAGRKGRRGQAVYFTINRMVVAE